MIVEVPFCYEIPYIPHRGRKKKTANVVDKASIEIKDLTAAEAPVAVRVVAGKFSRSWNAGQPRDYRYADGRFWRSHSVKTQPRRDNKMNIARHAAMPVKEMVRSISSGGGPFSKHGLSWKLERAVALDSLMPCRLLASPEVLREAEVLRIQSLAERILFVEGVAYYEISEPVYRVEKSGSFDQYTSIETMHVAQIEAGHNPSGFFRADRFDEAVAEYERVSGQKMTKRKMADVADSRIEVLMPKVLSFRYDMRPRVMEEAKEILSWMKDGLEKNDIAFASAFIRLRDALKDERDADHEKIVGLVGGDVAQALRDNDDWDLMIEKADALLSDWRNRDDASLIPDDAFAALAM
jgi:hypothetical protein